MSETYNVKLFEDNDIQLFHKWYKLLKSKNGIKNRTVKITERDRWVKNNPCPIEYKIKKLYDSGFGYKLIARNLETTYSILYNLVRRYFKTINERKGCNVVTEQLKEIRSELVLGEKSNFYDWPNKRPELLKNSKRFIQGYYIKKTGKAVWLRSSYEYIFAKWLDKHNKNWEVEVERFWLSNGEYYRPDFFIYDDKGSLEAIVEVKSRYFNKSNREYKYWLFREEYDIPCSLVTEIDLFTEENSNYHKELKKWKKDRLSKDDLKV